MHVSSSLPLVSVIIPARNAAETLPRCLQALQETTYPHWECIVVDDGSSDDSAAIAADYGARVMTVEGAPGGPAAARNAGARAARGDVLFFVDADVAVQPQTVTRAAAHLQHDPQLAACFGSYDDAPAAPNFLSQYKNLFHHYVHQTARPEASTFWAGCGAVRRAAFFAAGGFDVRYRRPSVEDIELGYRLCARGYGILLDRELQVKHLKRWTAPGLLCSDVLRRARPWSRLIVRRSGLIDDLNLSQGQRLSALAAWTALAGSVLTPLAPPALLLPVAALLLLVLLNNGFYRFLLAHRGPRFTLCALPWQWLYYLYGSAVFGLVFLSDRAATMSSVNANRLWQRK
jgi:GT2 family glycosyltransferase